MSRIEVNIHKVNDLIPSFSKVAKKISNTTGELASISARLDDRVKSRRGIDRRLHQITTELQSMKRKMQKLVSFLQDSMDEYSSAEEQITKQVNQYVEKIGVKKPKEKGIFDKILDGVQVGLDVVGLIPVVGEIADGVNGSIYLARGDNLNAALSFAAMVPVVGSAATGAKYVNKGIKYGEEIVDAGKTIKKPTNATDQLNQDSADALITPIVTKKSFKGSGNGSKLKIDDFTKEILETKPMNSPLPEKWYKKGGSISIDGNSTWTYTNKSGISVSYPNGYPDFTPYMHPNVKPVKIEVHSPKNNPKDFENANKEAKLGKDTDPPIFDIKRPPIGYTWHHHQDGKTMQLVIKDIHDEFKHIGGQSKINGKNIK